MLRTLRASLGSTPVRRLLACFVIGELATWVWFLVLAVYAYDEGGATAVGLAALARMLPAGAVAPAAGHVVDRFRRRDVVVAAVLAQATSVAAAAVVVSVSAPLAAVYVAAAAATVATALYRAGNAALVLEIADGPGQLAAVNVVETTGSNGAFLLGALAGGALMAVASPTVAFAAVALTHLTAALPVLGLPRRPVPEHREARGGPAAPGVRRVLAHADITRVLAFLTVTTLVEGAVDVLVVVVALDLLAIGDSGVGWLNAGWGLGGVLGGILCLRLLARGHLARGLALGGVLIGASLLAIAAVPFPATTCALLAVLGAGYALVEIGGRSLLQRLAPDDLVGRAFGLLESGYWLSTAAGAALAPPAVALLGTRTTVAVVGAVVPAVTVLVWRAFSRFERDVAVPEAAYAALRAVPALAPLPPLLTEDLAVRSRILDLVPGEVVVSRGDLGTEMFVVASGALDVTDCPGPVAPLETGDFFGELALVHDVRRTATVTAREPSRVVVLDGSAFLAAAGTHAYTRSAIDQVADHRWSNRERPVP